MSSEEQDAALLRIVKERSEAKRKRTLLESELQSNGKGLCDLAMALQQVGTIHQSLERIDFLANQLSTLLASSKLAAMMKEWVEVNHAIKDFDDKAKQLGID